jgi:hypothetical protein
MAFYQRNGGWTKTVRINVKYLSCPSLLVFYTEVTFIILACRPPATTRSAADELADEEDIAKLPMVGDVNLFLKGTPPHLRESLAITLNATREEPEEFEAELEIMIAGQS